MDESASQPIQVAITRTVKPGCEADFEQALHEFVQRSVKSPGQLGVHIIRPAPGTGLRDYGVIRRFANRDALNAFRTSAEYLEWNQTVLDLTEGASRVEELNGLESWFTLPNKPLRPLPKWKMAAATYLGVLPVAMFLNLTLGPVMKSWHFVLSNVVFNLFVVAILTWLVMPLLMRMLHPWFSKAT